MGMLHLLIGFICFFIIAETNHIFESLMIQNI